jgi:3-oxoadipate enol-lactonase
MPDRIRVGEVELSYEDTGGDGPRVVFVHGLGGNLGVWSEQLAAASARGYRAIAYDQRGAGTSDKPPGPYSVEGWATDLRGVLDELGLEQVALVGNSVAGMVVENAAVTLGARVWALATIGSAIAWRPEAQDVFAERVEMARAGRMYEIAQAVAATGLSQGCREERPDVVERMVEMIRSNDARAYAEMCLGAAPAEMRDLEQIACPATAISGSEDPVTPPDAATRIAERIPRGEVATIDGAAHWCMLEAPDAVSEAVIGFLDRTAPRS